MYNHLPRNLKDIDDMTELNKELFKYLNQLEAYRAGTKKKNSPKLIDETASLAADRQLVNGCL
nr:unnamed protein product [Callosobruchus analis]